MKRDGGSNFIARRIVILAKLNNEFNQLKLEKKRNYIFLERIRRWWWKILMCTLMFVTIMSVVSLLPFIIRGLIVLIKTITHVDISSAIHRTICELWKQADLEDSSGKRHRHDIFGNWKFVCYILVGNTCKNET